MDLARLLDEHAPARPCALVPEIEAWLAVDELPLWTALETALGRRIDAPFFCVPWPGAQALARAVLDGVVDVRGRAVADVGCGSGVASVAAAKAGAARVLALDVDPLAVDAAALLAARHGVVVFARAGDALADASLTDGIDVVLAGDLVSHEAHAAPFRARVAAWRARGVRVVLADSGRPFFDPCGLAERACYDVDVPRSVDGASRRRVRVYA